MRHLFRVWAALVIALVTSGSARAEDGVLVVQVADPRGNPIPEVIITVTGDGSQQPTDSAGRGRDTRT